MHRLRALIREHRTLAIFLLVAAFSIKALFPAGFMVSGSQSGSITITICADSTGGVRTLQLALPAKSAGGSGHSDAAKQGDHCAFSGLAKVAMGGADAVLLALAFFYILTLGLAPAPRLPLRPISYLRPPLRGPPAAA